MLKAPILVLDTNVLSELMRPDPTVQVLGWFALHPDGNFATTTINQAEILAGLAVLPTGRRKTQLLNAAAALWEEDLGGQMLNFDAPAAQRLGQVVHMRHSKGRPIQFADAAIAAICHVHGATVVTRDAGGFEGTGIKVINPWDAP
jgi:toxin FitB